MSSPRHDRDEQDAAWRSWVEETLAGRRLPFERHLEAFERSYAGRPPEVGPPLVWQPETAQRGRSNPATLMAERGCRTFEELHRWAAHDREAFWRRALDRLEIVFARPPSAILDSTGGAERARWLPGAELNIVDSCFAGDLERAAILWQREGGDRILRMSLGELRELTHQVAAGLHRLGLGPGDAVGFYLPLGPECVAAYLAVVQSGLEAVSIASSFPAPVLQRRLEIGACRAVVTAEAFLRGGRRHEPYANVCQAGGPPAIVVPLETSAPPPLRKGDVAWTALLRHGTLGEAVRGPAGRTTNVLFSSGTTGDPKAIPWSHLQPIKCASDAHFHHDLRPGDVAAWPTDIGWMMGPWLIYAGLLNGAAIALFEGAPTGAAFCRFVEEAGVTMLGVVPSLVKAWRTAGAADEVDWRSIRVFSSTGEPSNREDYLWLMSRAGYRAPVIEYCGGTEIGGGYLTGTVVQPASPATFTTPALGLDIAILDAEGRPTEEGENGELFVVPPSLGLSDTLRNADHHEIYYAGCPTGPDGATLRRHGDQMARLPGGFFEARGRADDAMNLGGIKIGALEIERVLADHPGVHEGAAVAVPAAGGGPEQLAVYLVPRGAPDARVLRDELNRRLAESLNPLFKIRHLELVDALPRTASNKIMRRTLRDRFLTETR